MSFNEFIADTKRQLLNHGTPYCFFWYQVEELIKEYGDNLLYSLDRDTGWYTVKLKSVPKKVYKQKNKPRVNVSEEQVTKLKALGKSDNEISKILGCSVYTVRRRLGKTC